MAKVDLVDNGSRGDIDHKEIFLKYISDFEKLPFNRASTWTEISKFRSDGKFEHPIMRCNLEGNLCLLIIVQGVVDEFLEDYRDYKKISEMKEVLLFKWKEFGIHKDWFGPDLFESVRFDSTGLVSKIYNHFHTKDHIGPRIFQCKKCPIVGSRDRMRYEVLEELLSGKDPLFKIITV